MKEKNKVLCVIPARGGSKSIPNKNIIKLNKKNLIDYTIEQSIRIKLIDKVIVSSDSEKIINKIAKFKKNKKFSIIKRPKKFSLDTSPTEQVINHTIDQIEKNNYKPDNILILEPTSPLRKDESVIKFIQIMQNNKYNSYISVSELSHTPAKIRKNKLEFIFKNQPRRRQDRKSLYCEGGSMYGSNYKKYKKFKKIVVEPICPILINTIESFDINNKDDLYIVESILKNKKK